MRGRRSTVLALGAVLLLPACGPAGPRPEPSPAPSDIPLETATVDPDPASPTPAPSTPTEVRSQPRVAAAIADLAVRESVRPEEVVVAASTPVTWADGSIGCPRPGMVYPQVQVEGELLILRVGTGLFQYNSRGAGPFRYCADPSATYTVQG